MISCFQILRKSFNQVICGFPLRDEEKKKAALERLTTQSCVKRILVDKDV